MRTILCLLLFSISLAAQSVIFGQASSGSFQGGVVVPEERFTEGELLRLARKVLQGQTQQKLVRVFLATTDEAVSEALTMSAQGERTYITFAVQYFRPGWASWGMAEAIRIGPDAILRVRYPDERRTRIILRGGDALLLSDGSEVIHVYVPPSATPPPQPPPVFFIRTSHSLSEATCNRIVAELRARSGLLEADVRVRNDRWFITDPEMPVRYAFGERRQIPGPVEFIEGRTALSGWASGGRVKPPQVIYPTRKPKYCITP